MKPINIQVQKAITLCEGQALLAEKIGVTQGFISQLLRCDRPVPSALCAKIAGATHGEVSCEELRPDVFVHEKSTAA